MRFIFLSLFLLTGLHFWEGPHLDKKSFLDVNGKQLTAQQISQELAYRLKDHDALSAKGSESREHAQDKYCQDFIVQTLSEEWLRTTTSFSSRRVGRTDQGHSKKLSRRPGLSTSAREEGTTF